MSRDRRRYRRQGRDFHPIPPEVDRVKTSVDRWEYVPTSGNFGALRWSWHYRPVPGLV